MEIGFINGKFVEITAPVIPIQERGHQFGDGVYEVVRVYNGVPFLLTGHIDRLERSANEIKLAIPYTKQDLQQIVEEGIHRSNIAEAEVYIQVTRGIAARNHLFPEGPSSMTMTVRAIRDVPATYYRKGVNVFTTEDIRWKYCYIKSLNLLPNILAKQSATDRGGYEAIFVKDNQVMEGSSTNVFAVKDQIIYTTPTIRGILAGITRQKVIAIAKQLNYQVVEDFYTVPFLIDSDEVFITSTVVEILPVTSIDHTRLQDVAPGPVTLALSEAYTTTVKQACEVGS